MQLRRKPKSRVEIFTGSMADVSFLLIIFFMLTTVFSAFKGIDLQLPPKEVAPVRVVPDYAVDVHVLADGTLMVDRKSMAIEDLLGYVGSKLAQDPEKPVMLRTDADATYEAMIRVLDELRVAPEKAGFEIHNLAIPTISEMQRDLGLMGWVEQG